MAQVASERSALRRTRLVLQDGSRGEAELAPDDQVRLFARALHAGRDGLVEVFGARRPQPAAKLELLTSRHDPAYFPRAGDLDALAALVRRHAKPGEEVFASPLTRARPVAGKRAVEAGWVAWVDVDGGASALAPLRAFRPRPQLVVSSGRGAHAYWRLAEPLAGDAIDAANRRLARHLGADLQSSDRGRVMRVPGSVNWKNGARTRVLFCDLQARRLDPEELLRDVAAEPEPVLRAPAAPWSGTDDAAQIAPPVYFARLAGVEVPPAGGFIACPLPDHEERTPSCRVFAEPERGWWCFGCARGGSAYDLASLLEGGPCGRALGGDEYLAAKRRVHGAFGLDPEPAAAPDRGGSR